MKRILLVLCLIFLAISSIYIFLKIKEKYRSSIIIEYLNRVYPLVRFENYPISTINELYDKLDYYYNPCSKYLKNDLSGVNTNMYDKNSYTYGKTVVATNWDILPSCNSIFNNLRSPKGNFFNFESYNATNIPSVYLTGKEKLSNFTSFRQTLPWGMSNSGGEISRKCRSGPGPFWIKPYSLVRNMYYPNGIYYDNQKEQWYIKCNMSNKLPNHGLSASETWTYGFKMGEYIEVTHAQNVPGMPQSIGYWFNGFPNGGTGIFLKIGITRVANNKTHMLFTLLSELKSKNAKDIELLTQDTKFQSMTGSDILDTYYKTDDPYTIVWGYLNGLWPSMSSTSDGKSLINPQDDAWKFIGNKGVLSASGLMYKQNIKLIGPDGEGYKPNMTTMFEDIALWWVKENNYSQNLASGSGESPLLTYENRKRVIDSAMNPIQNSDYFPNRSGGMVTPDEPICWLGFLLGIETIQMPMSANDNGYWCYEIIDLRIPQNGSWVRNAKERNYTFLKTFSDGNNNTPYWDPIAQREWANSLSNILSSRNPFSLSEYKQCQDIGFVKNISNEQCLKDAYPSSQFPQTNPILNFSGEIINDKCYTAIQNKGWQNLPCLQNSFASDYIKIPLMFPSRNISQ